jgi:hypothetical protein
VNEQQLHRNSALAPVNRLSAINNAAVHQLKPADEVPWLSKAPSGVGSEQLPKVARAKAINVPEAVTQRRFPPPRSVDETGRMSASAPQQADPRITARVRQL